MTDLLEVIAKLYDRSRLEHSPRIDHQSAVLQRVYITLYQEQIRTILHREETIAWNIDSTGVLEVLDSSPSRCLELL